VGRDGRRTQHARARTMPDPDIVFNRMVERNARRIDWHAAACRDEDPEAFFPVGEGQYASAQVAAAKAVCARCPLVGQCLNWALTAGIVEGIWGGQTEQERRKLRRPHALS
jgi:WhiB family redox-sensing transcriptional regulator